MARRVRRAMCALIMVAPWAHGADYVCVTLEYPPLSYSGANGSVGGLAVEKVRGAFARMGKTVDIRIYPWARAYEMARLGQADCIFSIARSNARAHYLDFSNEPLVVQPIHLYQRDDGQPSQPVNLARLKGARIGTVRQVYYGAILENMRSMLVTDEAASYLQAFQKLAVGRVDYVPSSAYAAAAVLASQEMKATGVRITQLEPAVDMVPTYVAFPKARNLAAIRDGFDRELRKFATSPEFSVWQARYRSASGLSEPIASTREVRLPGQRP